MANDYPDRSKQRRPGILSPILNTAKAVQKYGNEAKETLAAAQTGTLGKVNWSTNLLDMLGSSLYSTMQGKSSFANMGKSALEQSIFGMSFDTGKDTSVSFKTQPMYGVDDMPFDKPVRDYNLTFTKKF